MDQPTAKNMQAKNMQGKNMHQYYIHPRLRQQQEQLFKRLEDERKEAKKVMVAAIIEANTAKAKLPEGNHDQYKRIDDHILNAQTTLDSLIKANNAMSKLTLRFDDGAFLQKDMQKKIQLAQDVLDTLKGDKDDITRAHNAEHMMHEAVGKYNDSGRITTGRSEDYDKPLIFMPQPTLSSDDEADGADGAEGADGADGAEEAESDDAEEAEEADEADEPSAKRRAYGLHQGRACGLKHGSDCECDGDSD
jgi:hypothetical protein